MNENLNLEVGVCGSLLIGEWSKLHRIRPYWRIYWNATPGAKITSNGKSYYPDADHIIGIPPGIAVNQVLESPFQTLYFHAVIGFPYHSYPEIVWFDIGEETKKLVENLSSLFEKEPHFPNWSAHRKNLFNALVYRVIGELDEDKLSGHRISDSIRKTLTMLDGSVVAGVSNRELAKVAGLSLSAFLARFNRETGCAPQQYLLQKRLEKASYMLSCSDETIDRIANECGFCERSYFSRLFKRELDISPAEYRKGYYQ